MQHRRYNKLSKRQLERAHRARHAHADGNSSLSQIFCRVARTKEHNNYPLSCAAAQRLLGKYYSSSTQKSTLHMFCPNIYVTQQQSATYICLKMLQALVAQLLTRACCRSFGTNVAALNAALWQAAHIV